MEQIDFLAIGDITTDAFIKLKEAEVNCDIDKHNCKISMRFGDKIPYESVTVVPAVGNSPNAAVSAARLGLKSALYTNIGDDQNGAECLAQLVKEKIDTSFVIAQPGKVTNYHYVLWFQDERTILIKQQAYDYKLPPIGLPKWIYLSSMGEATEPFHNELADYLAKHPEINLAFQPGTFQMKMGAEKLATIYQHTKVFFCNVEEAQRILQTEEVHLPILMQKIHDLGPEIVVVTDGPRGAYMLHQNIDYFLPAYPDPKPPFERTGAGDAFSSTFVVALALGKTPLEALRWGPINSMSVVQDIGAQRGLLNRTKLEELLVEAPSNYLPKKI